MRLTYLFLAFLIAGSGSYPDPLGAATTRLSIDSNNAKRTTIIVRYNRLKKHRRPTFILLHGDHSTGGRFRRLLNIDDYARTSGTILVYPNGIDGRWTISPSLSKGPDDTTFLLTLINNLYAGGLLDRQKIFLAGFGSGGKMALQFACDHADTIAGVAAISAQLLKEDATHCHPSRPVPLLLINGTADPRMPYQGGKIEREGEQEILASTEETLAPFAQAADCSSQPRSVTPLVDRRPEDGSRPFLEKFNQCRVPIELLRIEGGGHALPGRRNASNTFSPDLDKTSDSLNKREKRNKEADSFSSLEKNDHHLGPQNMDVEAGRVIVDFFHHAKVP